MSTRTSKFKEISSSCVCPVKKKAATFEGCGLSTVPYGNVNRVTFAAKSLISLHYSCAFSQCSTGVYQAFDGQTELSRVLFNFANLQIHKKILYMRTISFTLFAVTIDCPGAF